MNLSTEKDKLVTMYNVNESAVALYVDGIIKKLGVCDCLRCRADIMALTLNSMPPRYVVTERGELIQRVALETSQAIADITIAITNAAKKVSISPRH